MNRDNYQVKCNEDHNTGEVAYYILAPNGYLWKTGDVHITCDPGIRYRSDGKGWWRIRTEAETFLKQWLDEQEVMEKQSQRAALLAKIEHGAVFQAHYSDGETSDFVIVKQGSGYRLFGKHIYWEHPWTYIRTKEEIVEYLVTDHCTYKDNLWQMLEGK